jgi:uncharacterized protein (TIGR00297 family)
VRSASKAHAIWRTVNPARWGAACLPAAAVAAAAWRVRALTTGGAAAATAIGTVVLARGGPPAAAALVAFFVTSSALSRFRRRAKERRGVLAQAKGARRDAWQVLANGGVAAACLAAFGDRGTSGFLGALAAAGADTWATELGLLAPRPPRLLTTLRPVPPGTSGGVTPEGTLAAIAGAATVGAAWQAARWLQWRLRPSQADRRGRVGRATLVAAAAGTLGAVADSLLGATLQAEYWCPRCHEPTEARHHAPCGGPTTLVRGRPWIDNDAVNAIATATGALAGATLATGSFRLRHRRAG